MASISSNSFTKGFKSQDGDYLDITYEDSSQKSDMRQWVLTFDLFTTVPYAVLYRHQVEYGGFGEGVSDIPKKIVAALTAAARRDGLI